MEHIEVFVEEKSMERFLTVFLPKILPEKWILNQNIFIRSFEGKQDLQKSLPKKIKVFSNWHVPIGIIVLQDQDSSDCRVLKSKLSNLITDNGDVPHLIRIVCKELESWYFGDLTAVGLAYPNFRVDKFQRLSKYRTPDLVNASFELQKILPDFQKVISASKIAQFIDENKNSSESFNQFVIGLKRFVAVENM